MNDEKKTREQLINELEELRRRIAELNASETQRNQEEQALGESEERYRFLFEQSPIGIGLASADGKVVSANKAMVAITGYSIEELREINLAHSYENLEDRKALLEAVSRYGGVVNYPVRLKRKDGTPYDALLTLSRVHHLRGEDLLQTICIDISERKRTEKVIEESQQRYSQLFEGISDAAMVCSPQGRFLDCNEATLQRLGYRYEELLCLSAADIVHPDFHLMMKENQNRVWAGETTVVQSAHCCKDGGVIPVEVNARRIEYKGGSAILAVVRDITKRKRMQEALREQTVRNELMLQTAIDGISVVDMEGNILEVNPAAYIISGYSQEEMVGMNILDLEAMETPQETT